MDWLEEKIEQFRRYLKKKSLAMSLVCYLCIGMLGVGTLYWITRNVCQAWLEVFSTRHQTIPMIYHTWGGWSGWSRQNVSGKEKWILELVNFLYVYCLYIYTLICFCLVGKIFLDKKVKPALTAIAQGLNYINMGDYSHEISWHSEDEVGKLCEEMEQMRKNMLNQRKDQWRQQEQQRKINAAFAHDIRTPLTVIRGYTEFLQKYVPTGRVTEEILLEKLNTMHQQEERLFRFSTTMTTIQNIEKWEPCSKWYQVSEVMGELGAVIQGLRQSTEKEICLHTEIPEQKLLLDKNLITEVFENLLSNALRFARNCVQIEITLQGRSFTLYIKDDGPGFSKKALRSGMDAYFSEEENSMEHFGIGLSICRMLCENHGGNLTLQNSVQQGAISAATLIVGIQNDK